VQIRIDNRHNKTHSFTCHVAQVGHVAKALFGKQVRVKAQLSYTYPEMSVKAGELFSIELFEEGDLLEVLDKVRSDIASSDPPIEWDYGWVD
jgi:hypothetical protein